MDHQDIASTYNQSAEKYAKQSIGREDAANLVRLAHLLRPGARILDVGCAAGRDSGLLLSMGFSVTGVDISVRLLTIAKKTFPEIPFILADMQELPFPNQSYDAVWASAVLHHIERTNMQQVLNEFNRVLKPGGALYILTKAGSGVLTTKETSVGCLGRSFTLMGEAELEKYLKNSGFAKQFSEQRHSKSRKNLEWLCMICKKIDTPAES